MTQQRPIQRIDITGVVQGVGFRPFIYRLAHDSELTGWVRNTSWGVEIAVQGKGENLHRFAQQIPQQAPPLAHIESIDVRTWDVDESFDRFRILHSAAQNGGYQLISPDIATCNDCLRELLDPDDRRYRYPFTNCTNCGPRFTIIEDIPYDRPKTTMRVFPMCPDCQAEYDDPLDRRFHAQPNACPVCGPHVSLLDAEGESLAERDEAMRTVAKLVSKGSIVALKGLGGFQLCCDASNPDVVARLRQRKRRPDKPFAVMVKDLDAAKRHVTLNAKSEELLTSPAAPILLLPARADSSIAKGVAPDTLMLGLMLPYTPLHHILLRDVDLPLVMTSGNISEEPIAADNDEAVRRLHGIADYFLVHNRDIYSRYDDSVWFVPPTGPQPMRRARGYAPFPIKLPFAMRPILAVGAELKNTFCLTREEYAFVSQHVGDMENVETVEHYERTLQLYRGLFRINPEFTVHDMHPDYYATRYAQRQPGPKLAVQHHHAHMVSCLADNGSLEPAIGVIMDGTGYGLDDHIWGGEFLVGDAAGFERVAHLEYLPLPGGDEAVRHPYRIAAAYVWELLGQGERVQRALDHHVALAQAEREVLQTMTARGLNTPYTSSAGRLFDAVSALLGLCRETTYEAQAAIALEMASRRADKTDKIYPWRIETESEPQRWGAPPLRMGQSWRIALDELFAALTRDLVQGRPVAEIGRAFHSTLARMIMDNCRRIRRETGLGRVALSGGCFQNGLLLGEVAASLAEQGFDVLLHQQVPCNDGGLSLGQAVIGHYYFKDGA